MCNKQKFSLTPAGLSRFFSCDSVKLMALLMVCMFAAASFNELAWADCQTTYNQALDLLDTTTHKASQNQHPNPDAFSTEFKTMVGALQAQKCMPELMSLIQHIQSEQQKLPSPVESVGKGTSLPITD